MLVVLAVVPDPGAPEILAVVPDPGAAEILAFAPDPGAAEMLAAVAAGGADNVSPRPARPAGLASPASRPALLTRRPTSAPSRRRVGPITIDPAARRVTLAGRPLALTRREYDLLAHLAAAPGRVFTKQELLESIWSKPIGGAPTRCLDAQVARLRRRLGDHRALLVTVWGVGYRLGGVEHP